MSRRRLFVLSPIVVAAIAMAGCAGGTGTVGSGPLGGAVKSCPTISYADPNDAEKKVELKSSDSVPIANDLGLGELLKDSCYYDIAASFDVDSEDADPAKAVEGGLYVKVDITADDAAAYMKSADKLLSEKKFEVTSSDTTVMGSLDSNGDGTDDISVSASYMKLTADAVASDTSDFYKQLGVKVGDSVISGFMSRSEE